MIDVKKKEVLLIAGIVILTLLIIFSITNHTDNSITSWKVELNEDDSVYVMTYTSPSFHISKKYKSMEGPVSGFRIPKIHSDSKLHWIIGYKVKTKNKDNQEVSDDFICHNNLDYDYSLRKNTWGKALPKIDAYPRLITLTQGQTSLQFPKGFGFPFYATESFSILTQVLNHNIEKPNIDLCHETQMTVLKSTPANMKPLFERSVFIMLPFDTILKIGSSSENCVPVDPNNHRYANDSGGVSTGHWIVKPGKSTYRHNITKMLNLSGNTTLHYAGAHAHPFSERLQLRDITIDSTLITLECSNFKDKIGLKNIESFSSELGILFSHLHEYELIVEVNNTTSENQDMMASMFLYFYDAEFDKVITENKLNQ